MADLPAAGAVAAEASELTKVYGEGATRVVALDRVSVTIPAGRCTVIMGPSGSGKSTLLHCMAALERPTSGRVLIGGTDVWSLGERERTRLRRDRLGFVFQAFNLVPTLTALENILLPSLLARRDVAKDWLDQVVATVRLGDRLRHRPSELSGGEQQRVAVARALVTRPTVIFADEPTGNLDSRTGANVLALLRDVAEQGGAAVVMVTHDPGAASYGDQVIFLADGRIRDVLPDPTIDAVVDRLRRLELVSVRGGEGAGP
jgi:ABC-type antimicrobial peptide transport system, ATPase component